MLCHEHFVSIAMNLDPMGAKRIPHLSVARKGSRPARLIGEREWTAFFGNDPKEPVSITSNVHLESS